MRYNLLLHSTVWNDATENPSTPSVKSAVQVPPRAASLYGFERGMVAALDYPTWEAGDCLFHQHHSDKMKFGGAQQAMASPPHLEASSSPSQEIDPMWRMRKWLEQCENNIDEEEVEWWLLV